jgi:Flp pilus assembly protein TadD
MRCPVCKADNSQGPLCRRCKADLSLLFQLEEERGAALSAARKQLAAGAYADAVHQAERADRLRRDNESRRVLAAACLLQRDFARAWALFQEARGLSPANNGELTGEQ